MAAAAAAVAIPASAQRADVELWRLDCGSIEIADFGAYSDTHLYDGKPHTLTDSCYLVRHGGDYLLWDTGLSAALIDHPVTEDGETARVRETIVAQLARIGVRPEQIRFVGISHRHFDHVGQARDFSGATLLIGKADLEQLRASTETDVRAGVLPWLTGGAKADPVSGDRDVFGDGSVTMLAMPGHTAGHHSLLIRLRDMGPVLLSGDQFHARESWDRNQVPSFNASRTDTLASSDRFRGIAANVHAIVVIQHEPRDIAKLPAFPRSAR